MSYKSLAKEPLRSGSKKLVGSDSIYRIRVGDYRIIYNIELPYLQSKLSQSIVADKSENYRIMPRSSNA